MSLPASDNFNRANGAPLGSNWTPVTNMWQVVAATHAAPNNFGYSEEYWSADAFSSDHYASVVNITVSDGGPAVRVQSGPKSYIFDIKPGNNTTILKDNAGSFTNLQTGLTTPAVNDICYIEAVGTTIKLKVNGTQLGTDATDASHTGGAAGLWGWDTNTIIDDFLADNVGGGGGGGTPTMSIHLKRVRPNRPAAFKPMSDAMRNAKYRGWR